MSIRSTMQSYVIIFKKKTLGSWILVKLVLFSTLSRRTHKQKYTIFEMQNEKPEDFFPEDSYVIYSIIRCNSTAYDDRWCRWGKKLSFPKYDGKNDLIVNSFFPAGFSLTLHGR